MKAYIAGPFFNHEQAQIIETIKNVLDGLDIAYFSPKDECMFIPGETTPVEILDQNIAALDAVDFCVCVTDGKDPGTMFEAGYCHANTIPLIYIWLSAEPGQKFNLMLAATGSVCQTYSQLIKAADEFNNSGVFKIKNWGEEIEYE